MNYNLLSGSELGRKFAPDTIKDREGWGRKTLRSIRERGVSITKGLADFGIIPPSNLTQKDVHLSALMRLGGHDPHQYKAPHALRGTPPRPHFSRFTREQPHFHV